MPTSSLLAAHAAARPADSRRRCRGHRRPPRSLTCRPPPAAFFSFIIHHIVITSRRENAQLRRTVRLLQEAEGRSESRCRAAQARLAEIESASGALEVAVEAQSAAKKEKDGRIAELEAALAAARCAAAAAARGLGGQLKLLLATERLSCLPVRRCLPCCCRCCCAGRPRRRRPRRWHRQGWTPSERWAPWREPARPRWCGGACLCGGCAQQCAAQAASRCCLPAHPPTHAHHTRLRCAGGGAAARAG